MKYMCYSVSAAVKAILVPNYPFRPPPQLGNRIQMEDNMHTLSLLH